MRLDWEFTLVVIWWTLLGVLLVGGVLMGSLYRRLKNSHRETWEKLGSELPHSRNETTLIERIMKRNFVKLEEVATGRFARSYSPDSRARLKRVEYDGMRCVSRSGLCVILEARWKTERQFGERRVARLRLVKHKGSWKLENLVVLSRYFREREGP